MVMRRRSLATFPEWVRRREHPVREARLRISMPVVIELSDRRIGGAVVDLSENGIRIRASEPIGSVSSIRLFYDGGVLSADVRWIDGLEFGALVNERANLS